MVTRIVVIFFICWSSLLEAQEFLFSNFSKDFNIPSAECYNVFQDKKGYIWFSTEGGLCKYNGKKIMIYGKDQGLTEKACYGVCQTPNENLFIITSKNRILSYNSVKDSFTETLFSEKVNLQIKKEQLYFIKAINDSTLVLCTQCSSFIVNLKNGEVKKLTPENKKLFLFYDYGHVLFPIKIKVLTNLNLLSKNNAIKLSINGKSNHLVNMQWKNIDFPLLFCHTAKNKNGDCFVSWNNTIVKISSNGNYSYSKFENDILDIYIDENNDLWIGTLKGGLLFFDNCNLSSSPVVSLPGISISGICVDNEKGIWCSSLEKGMFYSKTKCIISYQNLYGFDKKEDLLNPIGNELFCHVNNKEILKISENGITKIPFVLQGRDGLSDLVVYKDNYIFCGPQRIGFIDRQFKKARYLYRKNESYFLGASKICLTQDNRVFLKQGNSLYELKNDEFISDVYSFTYKINCLLSINDLILIGCNDGLYEFDLNNYQPKKTHDFSINISDIVLLPDSSVYISGKDGLLFKYEGGKIHNINLPGINNELMIFDLCASDKNTLWAGTNIGLLKIDLDNSNHCTFISTKNGLPANQINKVNYLDNKLFVSTTEGMCVFDVSEAPVVEKEPLFYFQRAIIDDRPFYSDTLFSIPNNYSLFQLCFDILVFKDNSEKTLVYKLFGEDGSVYKEDTVSGANIDLAGLQSGSYTLEVKALGSNRKLSKKKYVIPFIIVAAFYETWWFYLILILCLGFLITLFLSVTIKRIRKKEEEKTNINKMLAEYQLTALQAQMNPHFIFNAINSIQGYILNKDIQQAYDYLAKFGKLIRMVLHNSQEKTIVLKNEISLIELYLELEKLRFNNSFEVDVIIDSNVNLYEIQIPTMLIQPYIENAIWHGLMNLPEGKKGKLKINFKCKDEMLLIDIEDNGIGRDAAKEFNKFKTHHSVGMKLTEQRLVMINQIQQFEKAKVLITDLYELNKPIGTKVEIAIPLN